MPFDVGVCCTHTHTHTHTHIQIKARQSGTPRLVCAVQPCRVRWIFKEGGTQMHAVDCVESVADLTLWSGCVRELYRGTYLLHRVYSRTLSGYGTHSKERRR